jgi:uncharacterized protein YqeY
MALSRGDQRIGGFERPAIAPEVAPRLRYDVAMASPLTDRIKTRMRAAMQARDEVTRNILGLALGEIQTAEARANRALDEAEVTAVVRKLLKSNEETLALGGGGEGESADALRKEIAVLSSLLPRSMSPDDIAAALAPVADAVRAAKSDGQAMGVAMKHLKASGANAEAADVQKAVAKLRAPS